MGRACNMFVSHKGGARADSKISHLPRWYGCRKGFGDIPPFFAESDNFYGFFGIGRCPLGNATATTPVPCGVVNSFPPPITSPPDPASFTGTIQSQNLNFKQGRVQQFNLNIEHQLPGNLVLTAGYAGSRSDHILVDGLNLNVGSPGACGVVSGYTLGCGPGGTAFTAPYGLFTTVSNINDSGNTPYDSRQVNA